jgi:hypothetical protein
MTTDDETKSKRTRRAEPITRRNAKNGAITYTFQVDIGARPDGSRERQRLPSRRLPMLDVSTANHD